MSFISFNYYYNKYYVASIPENIKVSLNNEKLNISYEINDSSDRNQIYYLISNIKKTPSVDDSNWKIVNNNEINYDLDENVYYVYLKNQDNLIFNVQDTNKYGTIKDFKTNKEKIYLPLDSAYTPTLTFIKLGNVDETITWKSDNEKVAYVNEGGTIFSNKNGEAKITATIMDKSVSIDVVVSKLIVKRPKKYNYKKPYISCKKHSKKDNDLLDQILKDRINDAGYKTRAGAVEAARFLSLEFPYRINYFSENGRLSTNGIDAEGRYYHKGLYLHSSRYKDIGKKRSGPGAWGCMIYSGPAHGIRRNGLDCSGFISWVLYNGGFDVKDVGAGLSSNLDLTDYGKRVKFTKDLITNKKIKVGDLLSSGGPGGGHIAIIAGEDDKNYYVAESLWTSPNIGVVMMRYSKKTIYNTYYYVMLMDKYYKKDGNLTKMWY